MANLEKYKKDSGPKEYDPDKIPDGYNPMVWRLASKFKETGNRNSHYTRIPVPVAYSVLSKYLKQFHMDYTDETEELVGQMIEYYWGWVYNITRPSDYAFDEFVQCWEACLAEVKVRQKSKRDREIHDQMMAEKYPGGIPSPRYERVTGEDGKVRVVDADAALNEEKSAEVILELPDRQGKGKPKPPRHPLGKSRRPDEMKDFSPRVREWLKEQKQEREGQEDSE